MLPKRNDQGFLLLSADELPSPCHSSFTKGSGGDLAAEAPGRGLSGDQYFTLSRIHSSSANATGTPLKRNGYSAPFERPVTWREGDENHHPRIRSEAFRPSDVRDER